MNTTSIGPEWIDDAMQLQFLHNEDLITLRAEPDGDGWRVRLPDGSEHGITVRRLSDDVLQIGYGGRGVPHPGPSPRVFRVPFARTEHGVELAWQGERFVFAPATGRPSGGRGGRASGALTAPMVGVVADVLVSEGQAVEAYQPLVVVEAMKVMATVEAPFAGTVKAVHVRKNQRVAHGEPVVDIVPSSEGG
jgi:biotin carboxyl carrier protein